MGKESSSKIAKMIKNKFINKIGNDTAIEAYLPQLNIKDSISIKMKKLCQISVLSNDDINDRQRILNHIRSLFQSFYPDCLLIAFGSSVNGFGTKGCDMDLMFVPSSDYEHLDTSDIKDDGHIPTVYDARVNPSVMAQLKTMSKEKQLRFLLRVLRHDRNHIKNAVFIPAKKVPILRFLVSHNYHLWCDLSFQHGLAKFNTELLHFFSEFDDRIKPLMITLRFWAKHLKIVDVGAFSSYAFSLLVIFFLQNLEEPILPPVDHLMHNAESCIVDGWEAGFQLNDVQNSFTSRNTLSEEELLKEFFKFYFNFDFIRKVVCIKTGKVTTISDIRKDIDERIKKFQISEVCIQDPFDLSHNVSSSVKIFRMNMLKPYFFVAKLILSMQSPSLGCNDTLPLLFDRTLYLKEMHEHFFFRESCACECFFMYPNFEVIETVTKFFEKIWFQQASQAVLDILEHIFFINCEVIDKDNSFKDTDFGDGYSESERKHGKLLLSIQCAVDNRVWKYRNIKREDLPSDSCRQNFTNEVLREQNALSLFQLASNPALLCPEPFLWFLCNIYESKYFQMPYIWITLVPLSPTTPEFKGLSQMMKNFIPSTVKKMLINNNKGV